MGFADAQLKSLEAKLNGKHVRTRIDGGRELSYIEGWHAISEANRVFGFDGWDRETVTSERISQTTAGGVSRCSYYARVRIRVRAGDAIVVREGSGAGHGSARDAGAAHEQALKEAETDATKRALSTFGNIFGLALYDREQRGVRAARGAQKDAPVATRQHKGSLVLALSEKDLEAFDRPDAYCSAFRKVMDLIKSAEALMAFWQANRDTVVELRERYPQLKTPKGVHYAQLLGEVYTQRLQEFAARAKSSNGVGVQEEGQGQNNGTRLPALTSPPRRRDKEHLRYVASQSCVVCDRRPTQAHHLKFAQPRAMARKVSDEFTVPLCAIHHRELHDAGNEEAWWQRQKIDPLPMAEKLWCQSKGRKSDSVANYNSTPFLPPNSKDQDFP
ncbi:MAG: Rad52/Rad22 family DNA repair protein [Alphaproteobacteria bacterium]